MPRMADVRTAHTADLDPATLKAVRALLDDAFDGDMSDEDWDHTLGGAHVLLWEDGELIGHGAVVRRQFLHAGRAVRAGYVEGVGVRADKRGRGHGSAVMDEAERLLRGGFELGALSASDDAVGFYAARGWRLWPGTTSVVGPRGIERLPDEEGGVFVLPLSAELTFDGDLACDWRSGDAW
ncbi:GNAT family N-acetyltransferase [Streptomyces varsoviensis]